MSLVLDEHREYLSDPNRLDAYGRAIAELVKPGSVVVDLERVYVAVAGREARAGIGRYLNFYNGRRPHSSLDRQTPDQAYFNALTPMMAAA